MVKRVTSKEIKFNKTETDRAARVNPEVQHLITPIPATVHYITFFLLSAVCFKYHCNVNMDSKLEI